MQLKTSLGLDTSMCGAITDAREPFFVYGITINRRGRPPVDALCQWAELAKRTR